ncbi:MAG TPA: hypothetical protein VFW19_03915 [Allosphingosinicella sp.]|nr:hypothetical protein [Allosphingosinicella sp.]
MTEREEQIQDRTEKPRLQWIRPELHRLDAGKAEFGINPQPDHTTITS